jgi:hypothetical protein
MDLYDVIAEAHRSAPDPNHFLFSVLDLRRGYQQIFSTSQRLIKPGSRPTKERSSGRG